GLETNYGSNFGSYPVIHALATLAYDPRRDDFFRAELLHALEIIDKGHIDAGQMQGSWAGAMGHLQFMPSTFAAYAVDGDGDGRRDIWGSLPDVFASAANFLSSLGWNGQETWGREVQLPGGFDYSLVSIETFPETRKPLSAWASLGVRAADDSALPYGEQLAALLLPGGHEGPAFLVYENYRHTLNWNRSILYAIAVGHLADRLTGAPPLAAQPPLEEARVSTEDIKTMQSLLNRLGFDAGAPDGKVGPLTRTAIRDFQRSRDLPADAFPSASLLSNLRRAAGQ
ncbi:MAG: lytic murein transglycosylase, partial [Rhodovibrionaceae bacterium]